MGIPLQAQDVPSIPGQTWTSQVVPAISYGYTIHRLKMFHLSQDKLGSQVVPAISYGYTIHRLKMFHLPMAWVPSVPYGYYLASFPGLLAPAFVACSTNAGGVLQATNAGVRRPGNEARYSIPRLICPRTNLDIHVVPDISYGYYHSQAQDVPFIPGQPWTSRLSMAWTTQGTTP